ncbi:RNA polymerase sigma-70 factor [Pinibacter aurantiacus]|uniref:RNA polymerase sigma-70 factor n=1 Tax=Pinibacter aurantiacus TaxID=2851599 RepID=A0A9E2W5Q1_9BACT|nr:RNA polymerase sigma-70 factor [Pinibacter aurantiacus]MBV4358893.1 RNA polymerase sigma-70 factor [Pinibacter aurantiacus]
MSSTQPNTNETIVAAFQHGDERAFTQLYDQFYERLYFFACRFVNEAEAKDVTSEAFIQLWNKRANFDSLASVRHFLFVVVRNKCFDILKHEIVKTKKHDELVYLLDKSDEDALFLEQVRSELIRMIYNEVDKLPPKMKEIFLLSFAEGLKPGAIAQRLQISVQTVSNQKLSAIKILQAALGNQSLLLSLLILLYADL